MLTLNHIITRNAWQAFDAHVKREAVDGRKFTRAKLINMMAEYLDIHAKGKYTVARVRSALHGYMPTSRKTPDRDWRVDYLEAFAYVAECPVHRLTQLDFGVGGNPEVASYSTLLQQTYGKHLTQAEHKELLRVIRDSPRFEAFGPLAIAISQSLHLSQSRGEVLDRISRAVLDSSLYGKDGSRVAPMCPKGSPKALRSPAKKSRQIRK